VSRRLLPAFASVAVLLTGCATVVSDSATQPDGNAVFMPKSAKALRVRTG
jgi:hypothetical protein